MCCERSVSPAKPPKPMPRVSNIMFPSTRSKPSRNFSNHADDAVGASASLGLSMRKADRPRRVDFFAFTGHLFFVLTLRAGECAAIFFFSLLHVPFASVHFVTALAE